jgi:hypothetical protein
MQRNKYGVPGIPRNSHETLSRVGMAYYEPDVNRIAFENSHTVVFVYNDDAPIGFGRAPASSTMNQIKHKEDSDCKD